MPEEFKNYLILNVSSNETIKTYCSLINLFFNKYKEFNQETVNKFIQELIQSNKSSNYINKCIVILRKYSIFSKIIIEFPKNRKGVKSKIITLKRDEIEDDIIPYFSIIFNDYEKRILVFRFFISSCLRISELCNLKKQDIDFETGRISFIGKGNKRRETFIHPDIAEDLKLEVSKSPNESALNITDSYVRYMIKQINIQLNYKKHITPHVLRHAGARLHYDSGVNIKQLKDILGHSSLNTTDIYLNYDIEETQKAFNNTKFIKKGKKNG